MVELDLHGTRHEEVGRKLENFIYEHMEKDTTEIKVITGNSDEMRSLVHKTVKAYGMTATEEWGDFACLIVNLK